MKTTRRQAVAAGLVGAAGLALAGCAEPGAVAATRRATARATPTVARSTPTTVSLRGGTAVTVTGTSLSGVRSVTIGDDTVAVTSATATRVVFAAPASVDFRDATGTATLRAASGTALGTVPLRWKAADGTDRQLQYLLTYWRHWNPAYESIAEDDCVDFTSQSLLVRGWTQQGTWYHRTDVLASGAAWISSTSFMDFMQANPALGTALTDDERAKVKLGDVVQFDWDDSGDRDHTGVVTRVTTEGDTTRILFAGHTRNSAYRSVDTAITVDHPGGKAYYWSLA